MAIQFNNTGQLVKKWQQFLKVQEFFSDEPDGVFGPDTLKASKAFQQYYGIQQTGVVGSLTLGKAYSLGFNPDGEPMQPVINTDKKMMQWIKDRLGKIITNAIENSSYTEDWLAAICARETGFLFTRYANQGFTFENICPLMKGDYTKRVNDLAKEYHGFGFWQIDIASFPEFIDSGKWNDPLLTVQMAASVLNGKSKFLKQKGWNEKLSQNDWERAVTAAYNCGEGNVDKALRRNLDIDFYTYAKDYSSEVFRYRSIYKNL